MKKFAIIAMLFASVAFGDVTMPDDVYQQVLIQLKNLKQITDALPQLQLSAIQIVVDDEGRVFLPDELNATLSIAYLNYQLTIPLHSKVFRKEVIHKEPLFKFRYKFAGYESLDSSNNLANGFALMFEPINFKHLGFNLYAGTSSTGAVVSLDLLKNFSIGAGAGIRYSDWKIVPVVSASFSFN